MRGHRPRLQRNASAFLDSGVRLSGHTDHLIRSSDPAENMKRFHIGLMKLLAECRACVADNNDYEIAIRRLASCRADADVGNDPCNYNAVDASTA